MSLKYFTLEVQASSKEFTQYDVLVLMDVELIHKLDKDNLVPNALRRRKEFIGEKFFDTMSLKTIMYNDDSPLI